MVAKTTYPSFLNLFKSAEDEGVGPGDLDLKRTALREELLF